MIRAFVPNIKRAVLLHLSVHFIAFYNYRSTRLLCYLRVGRTEQNPKVRESYHSRLAEAGISAAIVIVLFDRENK